VDIKDIIAYKKKILFLSQPLKEAGYGSDENLIIKLSNILKKNNLEMVVKLHPAENEERAIFYESLGFKVLKKHSYLPVDLIFSILQPKVLLTVMSSAALNYNLRENGNVIWLENIFLNSNTSRFRIIEDIENVKKPQSFGELNKFLLSINEVESLSTRNNVIEEWDGFIKNLLT
jgi:hypothetical protein